MSFLSSAQSAESSLSNISRVLSKVSDLESNWQGKVYDKFMLEYGEIISDISTLSSHITNYIAVGGLIERVKELDRQISLYDGEEDKAKISFAYTVRNAYIKQIISLLESINSTITGQESPTGLTVPSGMEADTSSENSSEISNEETTNSSDTGDYPVDKYGIVQKNDGVPRSGTKEEKMAYLFPNGIPRSSSEASKYMVTTTVEYIDKDSKRKTAKIKVHEKLESDVQEIFSKVADTGFQLNPSDYGNGAYVESFCYRQVRGGSNLSEHSYGAAVDLNVPDNPLTSKSRENTKYAPDNNKYAVTEEVADIFRSYGWSWGGADWNCNKNGTRYDYMHFDFTTTGPQYQSGSKK